jgi:hypothetical protein
MSKCEICLKPGSTFRTQCGHVFHKSCLANTWKEWHLPCPKCRTRLAIAQVEKSGDCHIGFETPSELCICYTVFADTAKILKQHIKHSPWCRNNLGRLSRKPKILIRECSMCVA